MEQEQYSAVLKRAREGDINAFQKLFAAFQPQLKSYLYRLLTDRNDVEDLAHDTFIKAYNKLDTFKENSSLKTWVFRIGTNLAYDFLRKRKRWQPDAQDQAKELVRSDPDIREIFEKVHRQSPRGRYEVREHIDFCFTCISKTLPIEQQIAIILKDIYHFSRKEIGQIMDETVGRVKHLLYDGRQTMREIFDGRCALVNKNGACHQCSELAGRFNPKQARQEELMKIEMIEKADKVDNEILYDLRSELVSFIDPLRSPGADLQDIIMQCTRKAHGEIDVIEDSFC